MVNGSGFATAETLVTCRDEIDDKWLEGFTTMVYHAQSKNVFGILWEAYSMMDSIDTIAHACYGGAEEVGYDYYNWTQTNFTAAGLGMNVVLNLGEIYRDILGMAIYFVTGFAWSGPVDTIMGAGEMAGDLILNLFEAPPLKSDWADYVKHHKNDNETTNSTDTTTFLW